MEPLVTVITATTGRPHLVDCLRTVAAQTHPRVQHLVVVDGPDAVPGFEACLAHAGGPREGLDVVRLPYSIGKDRWNGHRIYGAHTFVAEGDWLVFLDDDNFLDPDHVASCLEVVRSGVSWAYTLRKIVDAKGTPICLDDCESLGKWPSILHPNDYLVDVNCYFLPKPLAVDIAPLWNRRFREPGKPEIDRVILHVLKTRLATRYECTYQYSVNYRAGNTANSVQAEFFLRGNEAMRARTGNVLPWKR